MDGGPRMTNEQKQMAFRLRVGRRRPAATDREYNLCRRGPSTPDHSEDRAPTRVPVGVSGRLPRELQRQDRCALVQPHV